MQNVVVGANIVFVCFRIPLSCRGDFVATMPKRHILVDPTHPSTSKRSKPPPSTNWDICVLCQVVTDESLQCPLKSTKQPVGSGYTSLAEDLLRFQTLQHMPMDLNLERLDDGDGIESTLKAHRAEWHKKRRLKLNKKAFDEQSRGELTTGQQPSTNLLCTRDLLTVIHSPQSLLVSSAMSLLALQTYIKHQPTTLTQLMRTLLYWPSLQQET